MDRENAPNPTPDLAALAALAAAARLFGSGVHLVLDTHPDFVRIVAWKDGEIVASATIR